MSAGTKAPVTAGVRWLRAHGASYREHLYAYEPHGGTVASARALGVDEHEVIKTLVMEDDQKAPLIVLMHGDREVSTQALARRLGRRSIAPCKPEIAPRHSGYLVGGTSPFGLHQPLPVYAEVSIEALPRLFINGGKRGFLVEMSGAELWRLLQPTPVSVAVGP
ncbi:MAG: YbaK/EbsC family protein [Terriglobales bacterium]